MSSDDATPAPAAISHRKPWRAPYATVLPVEETEGSNSFGNDGGGPLTGS